MILIILDFYKTTTLARTPTDSCNWHLVHDIYLPTYYKTNAADIEDGADATNNSAWLGSAGPSV